MISLSQLANIIKEKNYFLLLGHIDPDGDCIGSLFALKWALDQLGKDSLVLLNEELSSDFAYLAIKDEDYQLLDDFYLSNLNWSNLNIITLDVGDYQRLGTKASKITQDHLLLNIDHHPDNSQFAKINYVQSEKAATAEIIYYLIKEMGVNIEEKQASAIATGIISDTGAFRYQNTSAEILRVIADLIDLGVDIYQINKALFANCSFQTMKLKGLALSTLKKEKKLAYLKVDKAMLKKVGVDLKATSGLVNYVRDIKGVELGIAFLAESNQKTRVSFRSNNYCPVNEIAGFFGGGGHVRAAGCIIAKGLEETMDLVLSKVQDYV